MADGNKWQRSQLANVGVCLISEVLRGSRALLNLRRGCLRQFSLFFCRDKHSPWIEQNELFHACKEKDVLQRHFFCRCIGTCFWKKKKKTTLKLKNPHSPHWRLQQMTAALQQTYNAANVQRMWCLIRNTSRGLSRWTLSKAPTSFNVFFDMHVVMAFCETNRSAVLTRYWSGWQCSVCIWNVNMRKGEARIF